MTPLRLLGLLLLIASTPGCTTMVAGELPPAEGTPDPGWTQTLRVAKNDEVRLTLHGGEKVTGTVSRVDPGQVVLGKAGNYGWQETAYARADLARIEIRRETVAGQVMGATLAVAGLLALGLILLATQAHWPAS